MSSKEKQSDSLPKSSKSSSNLTTKEIKDNLANARTLRTSIKINAGMIAKTFDKAGTTPTLSQPYKHHPLIEQIDEYLPEKPSKVDWREALRAVSNEEKKRNKIV